MSAKTIIIGRDQATRKLNILQDGKQTLYGPINSVPMDVSRHHISLEPTDNGFWLIKNLNERNTTFVNGLPIERKTITESDVIELGTSRYLFTWESLRGFKDEIADIRPLKNVWEEYNNQRLALQIAERKFNVARSATGIITMLAIACSIILGHSFIYMILYALAIGVSIIFTIRAYSNSSNIPYRQEEIKKSFQKKYICPHCSHFLGFQDYDLLIQNDSCPNCKVKFKK